jgi:hypothetical protein
MNKKRELNEKKYGNWEDLGNGKRKYWFELIGKDKGKAIYLKEVDENEDIIRFWQEIYDENNKLIEIHEKYPVDTGHKKL